MNARPTAGAALAIITLGSALAGCGGSSGLSRSQIVAKANAICATANKVGDAVPAPSNFDDPTVAAAYFDKVEPIAADSTSKLEALKPDKDVSADWNAFVTERKAGLTILQTVQHKADTKDPSGLADLQKVPPITTKIEADATKLGANECAK